MLAGKDISVLFLGILLQGHLILSLAVEVLSADWMYPLFSQFSPEQLVMRSLELRVAGVFAKLLLSGGCKNWFDMDSPMKNPALLQVVAGQSYLKR